MCAMFTITVGYLILIVYNQFHAMLCLTWIDIYEYNNLLYSQPLQQCALSSLELYFSTDAVTVHLWWFHQIEPFSALLALCDRWIPSQKSVTRSFDILFDLRLNKWLSKQSWGWWFETRHRAHCNAIHSQCLQAIFEIDNWLSVMFIWSSATLLNESIFNWLGVPKCSPVPI